MTKLKLIGALAAVCLLAVAAGAEVITIRLTGYRQGWEGWPVGHDTYKSTVLRIRITTKDILNLIADAYHTNFPAGARLASINSATQVLDADGSLLLSVDYNLFHTEGGDEVYAGVEKDKAHGSYAETGVSQGHLHLDTGEANQIEMSGIATYSYYEDYWTGRYGSAFRMQAAGEGVVAGNFSVLTGTVAGRQTGVVYSLPSGGVMIQPGTFLPRPGNSK